MSWLDQDTLDELGPAFIDLDDGDGSFRFVVVLGDFSYHSRAERIRSSWEGSSECDQAYGYIVAAMNESHLVGMIEQLDGDEWEFRARRWDTALDGKP